LVGKPDVIPLNTERTSTDKSGLSEALLAIPIAHDGCGILSTEMDKPAVYLPIVDAIKMSCCPVGHNEGPLGRVLRNRQESAELI